MKITITIFLLLSTVILTSCQIGGPAFPKKDGSKYLQSKGASEEIIYKITKLKNMDTADFEKYAKSDDINVRHLIASNPHTPKELINTLAKDENAFVRQGVALNTSIDGSIIAVLKDDTYLTVVSLLVTNQTVPEDVILNIYKTNKKVALYYYAKNLRCPTLIKNDILKSNDDFAKLVLKKTEESIAAEQLEQNKEKAK